MYREPRYHPLRVSHSINVQLRWGTKIQILVHYIWYIYTHNLPSGWAVKVVHSRVNIYHVKRIKIITNLSNQTKYKNLDFLLYFFFKFRHWQLSDFLTTCKHCITRNKTGCLGHIFIFFLSHFVFCFGSECQHAKSRQSSYADDVVAQPPVKRTHARNRPALWSDLLTRPIVHIVHFQRLYLNYWI